MARSYGCATCEPLPRPVAQVVEHVAPSRAAAAKKVVPAKAAPKKKAKARWPNQVGPPRAARRRKRAANGNGAVLPPAWGSSATRDCRNTKLRCCPGPIHRAGIGLW